MGSDSSESRVCSWQTGGSGKPGMCMKHATEERKRHFHANVGNDNFFFVNTFLCDEHTEEFDKNPPPGEKDWREWKANPDRNRDKPRDPYLGTKNPHKEPSRKREDPYSLKGGGPVDRKPRQQSSRSKAPQVPDHPTCTGILLTGELCRKPIDKRFIGKGEAFHLCTSCAKDLGIS